MFVYIIAFIQQKLIAPSATAADAGQEAGQIIAITFAVLNSVGFILPALVLEPVAERIGRVRTHTLCVALMAVGYFGIAAFASTSGILYALMAVVGIGWGAVVSLPFAIMSESVDRTRMGLFMGVFNLSVVIPQLVVSLALGIVIHNAPDKGIIFLMSGGALAISALLWLFVREPGGTGPAATHAGH
jgi:MFS family permease